MKRIIFLNGFLLLSLYLIKYSPLQERVSLSSSSFFPKREVLSPGTPPSLPDSFSFVENREMDSVPSHQEPIENEERSLQEPKESREEEDRGSPLSVPISPINQHIAAAGGPESIPPPERRESESFVPYPKRIQISHTEGYGKYRKSYRTNYTGAEIVFAPDAREGTTLPFIDVRGFLFDDAKYALSGGLGFRYIPSEKDSFCSLLGANLYCDYCPDIRGFQKQMGAGVEVLGMNVDFRANFFAPFGKNSGCELCCDQGCVNGWMSTGFNAEVGGILFQTKNVSLYSAIGAYYVTACKCEERQRGGGIRLFPQYKDILGLNIKYSYDPLFKSIFQAEVMISVPFYKISGDKKYPCGITNQKIFQRVQRR